jgi:pyruvate, water dikinase
MNKKQKILLKGIPASVGDTQGTVRIINFCEELDEVKEDNVLVVSFLSPDFLSAIEQNGPILGIISDKGGMTCHAAIIARELKIPYVAGTHKATKKLKNGMIVRVDGRNGIIYG